MDKNNRECYNGSWQGKCSLTNEGIKLYTQGWDTTPKSPGFPCLADIQRVTEL